MKNFRLNTKSISLIGVFASAFLVTLFKIITYLRVLGAQTTAFYNGFYSVAVGVLAFITPAVICTLLCAKKEDVSPLSYHKARMPRLILLLVAGFSVCQFALNFALEIVWSNVCSAIGYKTFSPASPDPMGAGEVIFAVFGDAFGWTNALHALIATPLGAGVTIAVAFLAVSGMVGIIRLSEKRCARPFADTQSCAQNSTLSTTMLCATIVLCALATCFSLVSGVLA